MSEVDDFLAHYGVTGMKWGKRSGSLKNRAKGAMTDSVERRAITNRAIADGKGTNRDFRRVAAKRVSGAYSPARAQNIISPKLADKRASTLESRLARIKSGKTNKRDVADAILNTNPIDLLISRRDKRALPSSPKVKLARKTTALLIGGAAGLVAISALNNTKNRGVISNFTTSGGRYTEKGGVPNIRLKQNSKTGVWG